MWEARLTLNLIRNRLLIAFGVKNVWSVWKSETRLKVVWIVRLQNRCFQENQKVFIAWIRFGSRCCFVTVLKYFCTNPFWCLWLFMLTYITSSCLPKRCLFSQESKLSTLFGILFHWRCIVKLILRKRASYSFYVAKTFEFLDTDKIVNAKKETTTQGFRKELIDTDLKAGNKTEIFISLICQLICYRLCDKQLSLNLCSTFVAFLGMNWHQEGCTIIYFELSEITDSRSLSSDIYQVREFISSSIIDRLFNIFPSIPVCLNDPIKVYY